MHNSQDGAEVAKDFNGNLTATPNAHLTVSSCLGCHNGYAPGAPNIFGATAATRTAGGTFAASVVGSDPSRVHNVRDIAAANGGPGWTTDETTLFTKYPGSDGSKLTALTGATNLNCAGATGCHGDHSAANTNSDLGIKGFHHGEKTGYRYLQSYDGTTGTPIAGLEEATWEYGGATPTKHNVYASDTTGTANNSISDLCATCHAKFHGTTNTQGTDANGNSVWIRHPTENLLSSTSWTLASLNIDPDKDPLAFDPASNYNTVTTASSYDGTSTGAAVACVSCHRAHGTDYSDILRFNYADQVAGSTTTSTGCLGCHYKQRGS